HSCCIATPGNKENVARTVSLRCLSCDPLASTAQTNSSRNIFRGELLMSDNTISVLPEGIQTSKALNITLWVLQILAAAVFLMAGGTKLASAAPMVDTFEKIVLGEWFRYFTGGLEE